MSFREYRILDLRSELDVGVARVGKQATHMTAWRAGERPLDRPRDDVIVGAGLLDTSNQRAWSAGGSDAGAMTLLFYAPAIYRVFDRNLNFLMRRVDRFNTEEGGSTVVAGYDANEFRTLQRGAWMDSRRPSNDAILDYTDGPGNDTPTGAALGKLVDYTSTHYEYDNLKVRKMALIGSDAGTDVHAADILDLSGVSTRLSIDDVRRQVAGVGPAYKRVHLCVCRPLGEAAASTIDLPARDPSVAQRLRAGAAESGERVAPGVATQTATRIPISHLVSLITMDTMQGTVEETVQGAIAKSTGDYIGIDPAAGDRLCLPGYEVQEWAPSAPWELSDDALNAAG